MSLHFDLLKIWWEDLNCMCIFCLQIYARLKITITDINDNYPQFIGSPYRVVVNEVKISFNFIVCLMDLY